MKRRADGGSVLALFPAAFLIVLLLGAIAVDSALLFLRQREAATAVGDAANDVVTSALAERALRRDTASGVLDPARARAVVRDRLTLAGLDDDLVALDVRTGDGSVAVRATFGVDRFFLPIVPGTSARTVTVGAGARLVITRDVGGRP